ncbi:MAG: MerR family transcriptional regulator [Bifidobacteriaceae bacterium]|nr:MerR family transcriptional regulator [Bifidobacteriaceae bacterium]MCI1978656.1 MerR family transcriptional regulator [Bifidobacteriaceae bacterium]
MTMTIQGQRWYSVKEASTVCGLPGSTLRYYESVGVLEPARRDESSGHRVYSDSDLDFLLTVSCLNATGMPLDDMRQYLAAIRSGDPKAETQISLLRQQQERLRERMRVLQMQQQYLSLKVSYWQAEESGNEEEAGLIAGQAAGLSSLLRK